MQTRLILAILVIFIIAMGGYFIPRSAPEVTEVRASLLMGNDDPADPSFRGASLEGFARAMEPDGLTFPDAFGPHSDYQTEWWYYTGNVQTAEGRPFGFQFTIFRRSLIPEEPRRLSNFGTRELYMGHFALTDGEAGEFYHHERFQRGAGGAAGAQAVPYQVWLDDWAVEEVEEGLYRMRAQGDVAKGHDKVAIDFMLQALKPPALHGDNGLSQKSEELGNASYYYSQTRLETTGTVTVNGQAYEVSGLSWKDHEYSTSALDKETLGWDWFALQLSNERELMYYQLRNKDGSLEEATSGSIILEDGTVVPLTLDEVQVEVLDSWTSPKTGSSYPSGWRLRVPSQEIELTVTPITPNQELNVSVIYWEGAVMVEGTIAGEAITGRGYVELTGYDGQAVPMG